MTLNLQQARADWDNAIDRTADGEWAREYADNLLTALEARSGDVKLAERLEALHAKTQRRETTTSDSFALRSQLVASLPAILKALKGGV